jgi:hypothetical protein
MPLTQSVLFAWYEDDEKTWVAKIDDDQVVTLPAIAAKLSDNGWEIISVVPAFERTNVGFAPHGAEHTESTTVTSFAIFIKRFIER